MSSLWSDVSLERITDKGFWIVFSTPPSPCLFQKMESILSAVRCYVREEDPCRFEIGVEKIDVPNLVRLLEDFFHLNDKSVQVIYSQSHYLGGFVTPSVRWKC